MKPFIPFLLFSVMTASVKAQEKQPTNKHFWYTLETSAEPTVIWHIWTDVANWKNWDTGLKDASLKDIFNLGAEGKIISLEGRKSSFKVVEYKEGISYTFKTKLPLGGLYIKRYLQQQHGKTYFTHEVWFSGLTSGIFAKKFGSDFKAKLPQVMNTIKAIAEKP